MPLNPYDSRKLKKATLTCGACGFELVEVQYYNAAGLNDARGKLDLFCPKCKAVVNVK
jgi:uncharacterized CHY-type Zn-finger protein